MLYCYLSVLERVMLAVLVVGSTSLIAWAYTAYVVTSSRCMDRAPDERAARIGEVIELASVELGKKKRTPVVMYTANELEMHALGSHINDRGGFGNTCEAISEEDERYALATPLERDERSSVWVVPMLCQYPCPFNDRPPAPPLSYPF